MVDFEKYNILVIGPHIYEGFNGSFVERKTLSYDNVIEVLKDMNVKPYRIVNVNEEYMILGERLRARFGMARNGVDTIGITRTKNHMKEIWGRYGISTPRMMVISLDTDLSGIIDNVEYPVIVKPSVGFASCGVRLVSNGQELKNQVNKARVFQRCFVSQENIDVSKVLIEEYIEGEEFSVDTIWYQGLPLMDGVCEKGIQNGPTFPDSIYNVIDEGHMYYADVVAASHAAVKSLKFTDGVSHTEIRIKGGQTFIIESTGRPGGGGLLYPLFEQVTGVNFFQIQYLTEVSEDISVINKLITENKLRQTGTKSAYLYCMPYKGAGRIKKINGLKDLKKSFEIKNLLRFKYSGDYLLPTEFNHTYFLMLQCVQPKESLKGISLKEYVKKYDDMISIEFH